MSAPYTHKIQYYETDMMGVTHHANYLHFMEEARIAYLDELGYSYARMEQEGVFSPVVHVSVQYKQPTTFGDELTVRVRITQLTAVRLLVAYEMCVGDSTVCIADSTHCFTDRSGKPISLKRANPQLFELLAARVEG